MEQQWFFNIIGLNKIFVLLGTIKTTLCIKTTPFLVK